MNNVINIYKSYIIIFKFIFFIEVNKVKFKSVVKVLWNNYMF